MSPDECYLCVPAGRQQRRLDLCESCASVRCQPGRLALLERLETQHRPGDAFDCTIILLDEFVEVFDRIRSPRQEIAGVKSHTPEC